MLYSKTTYCWKDSNPLNGIAETGERPVVQMLYTDGSYVRITGLRLRGPFGGIGTQDTWSGFFPNSSPPNLCNDCEGDECGSDVLTNGASTGIRLFHPFAEIDNCELYDWNLFAIDSGNVGAHIHHNYIHHTQRSGQGYGVHFFSSIATPPCSSSIPVAEANLLEQCRHEIASSGQAASSYIARYNMLMEHQYASHLFDRHGGSSHAGYYTEVSRNVVTSRVSHVYNIRGIPEQPGGESIFNENWISHFRTARAAIFLNKKSRAASDIIGVTNCSAYDQNPFNADCVDDGFLWPRITGKWISLISPELEVSQIAENHKLNPE